LKHVVRVLMLIALTTQAGAVSASLHAQHPRRGGGVRVGIWNVDVDPWVTRSVHVEGYVQRGLENDLALENSIGVWRAIVNQTKAYVVPLLTSLKYYPVSEPDHRFEPYVSGGLGVAFGIQDEPDNAIGGTGTTIVTGVAVRAGAGVEVQLFRGLGLAGHAKYQWAHFGDEVGTMETFAGVGVEGAVIYRFRQ
jgi:hypothetical protein